MMISPESYVEELKNLSYTDLINERKKLIEYINSFEKNEMTGDRSGAEWQICPSPEVRYQCNLEYLSALCCYMKDKYNDEYVSGEKTLSNKG